MPATGSQPQASPLPAWHLAAGTRRSRPSPKLRCAACAGEDMSCMRIRLWRHAGRSRLHAQRQLRVVQRSAAATLSAHMRVMGKTPAGAAHHSARSHVQLPAHANLKCAAAGMQLSSTACTLGMQQSRLRSGGQPGVCSLAFQALPFYNGCGTQAVALLDALMNGMIHALCHLLLPVHVHIHSVLSSTARPFSVNCCTCTLAPMH